MYLPYIPHALTQARLHEHPNLALSGESVTRVSHTFGSSLQVQGTKSPEDVVVVGDRPRDPRPRPRGTRGTVACNRLAALHHLYQCVFGSIDSYLWIVTAYSSTPYYIEALNSCSVHTPLSLSICLYCVDGRGSWF